MVTVPVAVNVCVSWPGSWLRSSAIVWVQVSSKERSRRGRNAARGMRVIAGPTPS